MYKTDKLSVKFYFKKYLIFFIFVEIRINYGGSYKA